MDATTVQALINTLNRIPITGKDAMSMMMGCIVVLEKELKRLQEAGNGQDNQAEGRE